MPVLGIGIVELKQTLSDKAASPAVTPATRLTNEQLRLKALCSQMGKAPPVHPETEIGLIQALVSRNNHLEAIEAMGNLLAEHGLDSLRKRYDVDPERFKSYRNLTGLTQAGLAERLTVGKEQVSHYETGRSGIGIESLLLALSIFGVNASEIVRDPP